MAPRFDNVTQEALTFLKEHFPRTNSMGNILLTTRTKAVAEGVVSVAEQAAPIFRADGSQHSRCSEAAPERSWN